MKKISKITLLILLASVSVMAQSKKEKQRIAEQEAAEKAANLKATQLQEQAAKSAAWPKSSQGAEYKIFTNNGGTKIKLNDVITFNFTQKTDKDSVIMSSYQNGQPVKLQVQKSQNIADLMEIFPLLAEKDSALVKIPTDSIFKNFEAQRPPFLPKGSLLLFALKIEKVQSLDSAIAENNRTMERMKGLEKATLGKYIADNKLNVKATPSGLMYIIKKASAKPKPMKGDTVYVNYTGRTIDGKVFDTSVQAVATQAGLAQPGRKYEPIHLPIGVGQVIKGWDEGIMLMNEGSSAKLIIQSDLGYGPQGGGEAIPPYSSLIFDVDLVKVKHPKAAVKNTAKSTTGVKKPATKPAIKKPVVKPTAKKQ